MSLIDKLVDVYHNSQDPSSLTLTVAHDFSSNFVMVSWYIIDDTWYIPLIYDKHITGVDSNNSNGWYLNEKPNIHNIPVRHTNLTNLQTLEFNNTIIQINTKKKIPKKYLFIIEVFMKALAADDIAKRDKYRQQILISNICHSIRTPLNGILHMTNMLMATDRITRRSTLKTGQNPPLPPSSSMTKLNNEHLSHLNQSTVSLANNIFDIIDITQLSINKLKINKDVFNVRELIHQVIAVAKSLTKNKNVDLEYHVEPIVPDYAFSDMKRLKQILINLLSNAFHNTKKGEVTLYVNANLVYLNEEDDVSIVDDSSINQYNLSFVVRDTGAGINSKMAEMLFKPPEVMLNSKQYGIGLRVSYLLAKRLGGDLNLSHTSDKGSSFVFNLIMYEEEQPRFDSNTLKSLKGKRILLLDDSSDKVNLCKLFDDYGMIYTVSSSYEEILVLHLEKKFDLVVCQTNLKDKDGLVIAEQLVDNYDTLLMAIADDNVPLPHGLFHARLALPSESFTVKSKLMSIFNTKYDAVDSVTKLLVVEDEPVNRIIIEKLLRSVGYTCIDLASNGKDALDMVNDNKYDVLLVDIRMPIMSGFELAQEVSKLAVQPKMVGVTAQMIMKDDPNHLFDDFVHKPIDIEELNKKIKRLL
jgi:two-component system sensor histidine kinase/response regulator